MKRFIIVALVLFALPAVAQTPKADFEAATERALAGDDAAAIALFESLIEAGVENEDVYFNLGNVYARADRRLDAIVAYERALRLAPNDGAARRNLQVVRASLVGHDEDEDNGADLGLADVVEPLVRPFPRVPLAYGLLAINAVLVGLLMLRRRRLAAVTLIASLAVGAIVAGHAIVANDRRGIVKDGVDLRRGPNAQYETRGTSTVGERVRLVGETEGWLEIQNPDGTTGWLLAKHVEPI